MSRRIANAYPVSPKLRNELLVCLGIGIGIFDLWFDWMEVVIVVFFSIYKGFYAKIGTKLVTPWNECYKK